MDAKLLNHYHAEQHPAMFLRRLPAMRARHELPLWALLGYAVLVGCGIGGCAALVLHHLTH